MACSWPTAPEAIVSSPSCTQSAMEISFLMIFDLAKNALPDTTLPIYPGLGLALGAHWNAPPEHPHPMSRFGISQRSWRESVQAQHGAQNSCGFKHRTFLLWGQPLHNYCINELSCEISCPKGQRSASPLHVNFLENMFQDSLLQNNRLWTYLLKFGQKLNWWH